MLDHIELLLINLADETINDELCHIKQKLQHRQSYLEKHNQLIVAQWIQIIRSKNVSGSELRTAFMNFAQQFRMDDLQDKAGYDALDVFIEELFDVDYIPEETKPRTSEMVFFQPTPVRIILAMLNEIEFGKTDCFYDIGSGLGRVALLVALLTEAQAIGIEYEPTYVAYAQGSVQKLNLSNVSFLSGDARDFDYGNGTIFFLYTPFSGDIFAAVNHKLAVVARQKPITICSYGTVTSRLARQDWLYPISNNESQVYKLGIFKSKLVDEQQI